MKKKHIRIVCLFVGNNVSEIQKGVEPDSLRSKFSFGIHGMYLQNKSFSRTFILGSSLNMNSKHEWLSYYITPNYVEYNTLTSFGGLFSGLGFEAGTRFTLSFSRRFSSSLLTGIGYHRIHIHDFGQVIKNNTMAVFGTVEINSAFKKFEFGALVGSSIGRGPAKTYQPGGLIKTEQLFSSIPKLGIQFKYFF